MSILDKILGHKRKEVGERKIQVPVRDLEQSEFFRREPVSMGKSIRDKMKSGIIAEIKRKSPSKGVIHAGVSIQETSVGYREAGASAISVLTDAEFFSGSNDDLMQVRKLNDCPLLRKDFTIDEYQIVEAKSIGADAVLLIAAALDPKELKRLCKVAHELHLEVLLEVHDEDELKSNLDAGADLIGVNNRNLKTFEVTIETSRLLAPLIPEGVVPVSESGIESPRIICELRKCGYQGFLIGQAFMQEQNPGHAAAAFIQELRKLENPNERWRLR